MTPSHSTHRWCGLLPLTLSLMILCLTIQLTTARTFPHSIDKNNIIDNKMNNNNLKYNSGILHNNNNMNNNNHAEAPSPTSDRSWMHAYSPSSLSSLNPDGYSSECVDAVSAFGFLLSTYYGNCSSQLSLTRTHGHRSSAMDSFDHHFKQHAPAGQATTDGAPGLCQQLNQSAFFAPLSSDIFYYTEQYFYEYNLTQYMDLADTLDLTIDFMMDSASSHGAAEGEVAYILNKAFSSWSVMVNGNDDVPPLKSSSITTTTFFEVWLDAWSSFATNLQSEADEMMMTMMSRDISSTSSPLSLEQISFQYLRAANYFQVAQQPNPIDASSVVALNAAYASMFKYLDVNPTLTYLNVSIPYTTDDGVDVNLRGYFISVVDEACTESSCVKNLTSGLPIDASRPLLSISVGGMDYPLPGAMAVRLGPMLEAGFSVFFYEGPGQGLSSYDSPPLVFTSRWDRVITAVHTTAASLSQYWNSSLATTTYTESLGGFLGVQACSNISSSLVGGCVVDPATPSMTFAMDYSAFGRFIAPFESVDPSLLASLCPSCAAYIPYYSNVTATSSQGAFVADALISGMLGVDTTDTSSSPYNESPYSNNTCSIGSDLLTKYLVNAVATAPINPDFQYLILKFVPPSNSTYTDLTSLQKTMNTDPQTFASLLVMAFRRIQAFRITKEEAANTQMPICALGGTEDFAYETCNGDEYFEVLPSTELSLRTVFSASSGAALHDDGGAFAVSWPIITSFLWDVALSPASK